MEYSGIRIRHWLQILAVCLGLAIVTTFVSANHDQRFPNRSDTVNQQLAILAGDSYMLGEQEYYFPSFQNRVLFPALLSLAVQAGYLEPSEWYLLLRIGTAFLAFTAFIWSAVLIAPHIPSLPTLVLGGLLLAFSLLPTFNHGWEHPTDFLDVFFMCFVVTAVTQRRFLPLLILTGIAAANRESAVFGGVIWLIYWGLHSSWKTLLREILRGGGVRYSAT